MAEVQGAEGHQASPKAQPDAKRQQLRNVRLLLILPFAATAVLLAPLGILRKSAEVDITLKVSRVSFKMGEQGSGLFRGLTTSALSLVSYQEVNLGLGILENATTIDPKSSTPSTWRQIGKRGETRIVSKDHFSSVTLQDVSINHLAIPPGSVSPHASGQLQSVRIWIRSHHRMKHRWLHRHCTRGAAVCPPQSCQQSPRHQREA